MFSLLFSEGCGFLRLWSVKHADSLAIIGPIPQCEGIPFAQWVLVQMGWERVENMVEKVPSSQEALPILRPQDLGFRYFALAHMSLHPFLKWIVISYSQTNCYGIPSPTRELLLNPSRIKKFQSVL